MFEPKLMKEITEIAKAHDIEPEALMAVVEVESNGRLGAKVNGRMEPLIRFEGHYFYRLLPNAKRNKAVVRGLGMWASDGLALAMAWLWQYRWFGV